MVNDRFCIKGLGGEKKLDGTISVNGAKNAVLKIMAATVLFGDKVILKNVPDIEDVRRMADLLEDMGAEVKEVEGGSYTFFLRDGHKTQLSSEISKKLRASIVLTGPVLARAGEVSFPYPGGCEIGLRPIDIFLDGFRKMGARERVGGDQYTLYAPGGTLKGANIFLRKQSVTATETFMMAGVLADGETVIENAALEPEIQHLAQYLNECGASIIGAGTPTIKIVGGNLLLSNGKEYITPPDRIEAGSFLILGALSARNLKVTDCNPAHLTAVIEALREAGVVIKTGEDYIDISNNTKDNSEYKSVDITTHEYPGFPTDLQALMAIFLTQVSGESVIFETIFENRLGYAETLSRMGANVTLMDPHRIMVRHPKRLYGKVMESPDLRAGLAFIIAAIVAEGDSVIHNIYNVDRGYEKVEERLRGVGVDIKRVSGV